VITGFTPQDVAAPLKTILETMHAFSERNFANIPFSICREDDEWAVYIDVRLNRDQTFDIRTADPSLPEALRKALIQLRRNL
jgi:hypothetical protein